jgi:DNA-binding beta-propeller fold protein YncE
MRRILLFCLLACFPLLAQQAPIPTATELPGSPFSIKKTWLIGGAGNWDYLTIDPAAKILYIAHGSTVQIVDVDSGSLAREIKGFREAHSIALDDTGRFGYVSDGPAGEVKVFDRQTFQIAATIPISCLPRSIAFEPASKLVFAICGAGATSPAGPSTVVHTPRTSTVAPRSSENSQQGSGSGISHVVAIDTDRNRVAADIAMAGDFRFAQPDGYGLLYVSVGAVQQNYVRDGHPVQESYPPRIAKLDGPAIAAEAGRHREAQGPQTRPDAEALEIDWSHEQSPGSLIQFLKLNPSCENPQGLAVDRKDQRLFAACENQRFAVLDGNSGALVASLTTGPGDAVVAYDRDRGMIFVANGAGYGSLTIISQDATTDSYAVIQNLPTQERARTLAVDSATGEVYLVTDFHGVDLTKTGGIGSLHSDPVPGSFQVLVVSQ